MGALLPGLALLRGMKALPAGLQLSLSQGNVGDASRAEIRAGFGGCSRFTAREGCRGCPEALVLLPGFAVAFLGSEGAALWGWEEKALGELGMHCGLGTSPSSALSSHPGLGWGLHGHRGWERPLATEHTCPGAWQQGTVPSPAVGPARAWDAAKAGMCQRSGQNTEIRSLVSVCKNQQSK